MRSLLLSLAVVSALHAGDSVLARVDAHAAHFGDISRQIWEAPEVGFHETRSSALLQDELRRAGFTIQAGVAGMPTAFTAQWGSGQPVIALIGEFDALPGLSQKDVAHPEPVTAGAPGHGCGHNLLGTASALAAVAVKEELQARGLKGTVRFYGAPAEEGGGGKIYMLHAGLFRDVDAALTWHPADVNQVNLQSSLANNGGRFRFHGTAAHAAAAPERGRSALDGVMVMLNAVELLREHVPQETRIHYIITNGGSAPNIVPAFAEVSLIARNPDAVTLNAIWERILKCAQAGALATETTLETVQGTNYANVLPNDTLAAVAARSMRTAGGYEFTAEERQFAAEMQKTLPGAATRPTPDKVLTDLIEGVWSASTDVGDVSWNVPTININAATFVPGTAPHTWQSAACAGTSIGRKGMVVAARTLALTAVDLIEHPKEIEAAKADFEKRKAGHGWITRIQSGSKPPMGEEAK